MSKKLDSKPLDRQTEKKDSDAKQVEKLLNDMGCDVKVASVGWGENLIKDSRGEKARSLKIRTAGRGKASLNESGGDVGSNPTENSKLPEVFCPFCGRKLIRYKQAWICGHGCTKPALKPKEKNEPKNDEPWECPICHKTVYIGYTVHRHCLDKLIEGFIKFIDHFEERYEGNKCGECLEYWKTIKEHYKGA